MAKTVLITGASTGIGQACVKRLNSQFQVFAGVRKEEDAKALRKISQTIIPLRLDVTEPEQISKAMSQIKDVVGSKGLDALVNNAGIAVTAPLEFLELADMRQQLEVNVVGVLAVTQAMLPLLRQSQGRIVNMGSISGKLASPLVGAYVTSKFALEGLNDSLRLELKPFGIEVSLVEPGPVDTPIWDKSTQHADKLSKTMSQEAFKYYGNLINKTKQRLREAKTIPADAVAAQVEHALTAKRPRIRYVTGNQARLGAMLARFLPDKLLERLVLSR